MSSDMANNMATEAGTMLPHTDQKTIDDSAYVPTYRDAFPPLPPQKMEPVVPGPGKSTTSTSQGQWANKLLLKTSTTTQIFRVPLEERRFKEMNAERFGEQGEQASICYAIMQKTGVAIEMSLAKDQSLTVVITGKLDAVMRARRMVINQLQTQASLTLNIPKEHHKYILGRNGKKLQDLELATATKIKIPRPEENSDALRISGNKEGIDKAAHEIQVLSDEQAKLAFERLPIPKMYHPFILGPGSTNLRALKEMTQASINIPPLSVQKDEITVSGEKEGVQTAVNAIMKIYEEKKRKCQTVSVEVRKSQHKYVIGPKGTNLNDILALTGVSVEIPPLDSDSDTITLRGEQDKLGPALTMVYSKANSVVIAEVLAPAWLHRFIIGRKGSTIQKITKDLPKVHIEFTDGEDKIVVEGPPEEVQLAQVALEEITRDLQNCMACAEVTVEQRFHRHIIGKNGANVTRLKNETGVAIHIPADITGSNVIRIEGDPAGVEKAKTELLEMVHKMENEKSRDVLIEQRFHKTLIGTKGEEIRKIRDQFNQVQVTFPDPGKKSSVVTLRGPKTDVDKCHKHMNQLHQELIAKNYQAEVHIFKKFHKNIIGKGGANIRKIRDETDTRIDLPSEDSESDAILITGKKADVDAAKAKIEHIQKELANIKEIFLEIPHQHHNSIIGARGRLIRSIMDECGGVIIRFPAEGSTSDKVVLRGPADDVENAKKQLVQLANERKEAGHTAEIKAKASYHKFLIGKGGANIRKVRETTGARIVFPTHGDADQELITIIGKKEEVDEAKRQLEASIKGLDDITESDVSVDPVHHRHFVARRGEVLQQIAQDYGGVAVSFPRSGIKSDKVVLKGAINCVEGARQRILEIVADLESRVTIECVIPQKYHRTVMGAKGNKVQDVTREFDVSVKFPEKPHMNRENDVKSEEPVVNGGEDEMTTNGHVGDELESPRKQDVILITGKKENVEEARDALMAFVPVTEEVIVPYDFHRFIIGKKGVDVRKLMEEFDVNIAIPPSSTMSDVVRVTGPPRNVNRAKEALQRKCEHLESEREDKALRSFQLTIEVDPAFHPKIIGRRGAVISKIRDAYNVQIQFPDRSSEEKAAISIMGYEKDAMAAREDILKIVGELEDMVTEEVRLDRRIHSRLIGAKGRAIRKIMDEFKVDIKFPRTGDPDPDLVKVTGREDNVMDCKDHLLNLEEEYLQEVNEKADMERFMKPPSPATGPQRHGGRGFVVAGGPWEQSAPDTRDNEEFPTIGETTVSAPKSSTAWGPKR